MARIRFDFGALTLDAELLDTPTAKAIAAALPISSAVLTWGEEVYFDVPLQMENENPSPAASAGDVCYWSPGPAFCIFFGKTQPYSAVNHIGKITEGLEIFRQAEAGDRIIIRRR